MAEAEKRPQFGNRFLKDPRQVFEHNACKKILNVLVHKNDKGSSLKGALAYIATCSHRPGKFSNNRPPGGGRPLVDKSRVWEYNQWDNVEWDEEQEEEARRKIAVNSAKMVDDDMQEKYESEAFKYWDDFYTQHQNRFFKDRHWLFTEFPELLPEGQKTEAGVPERIIPSDNELKGHPDKVTDDIEKKEEFSNGVNDSEPIRDWTETELKTDATTNETDYSCAKYPGSGSSKRIFEVGCGVGNTVFPVLQTNNDPGLFVYCCDLSQTAIELVRQHDDYKGGRCHGFVCDVSQPDAALPFPDESLDLVILIFVLSAVHPEKMQGAVDRLARLLKPGGKIVFRDYGRYDLAQLRFKNGRCLSDNFYVRGDGTRVYFFTQEGLDEMFKKAGLEKEQNIVDRRLQVNRGRQLKMYRVWIQCKYLKPTS